MVTCLVAAALAAAAPTAAARRAHRSLASRVAIGLNADTQGWGSLMGVQQDRARRAGARWLRESVYWYAVEPRPGVWDWSRYDLLFRNASRRGLRVLPLLWGAPSWAGPAYDELPADPAAFADYVAHVAARYGPGGDFWRAHPELDGSTAPRLLQIWNEPYLRQFSNGNPDPGRYARLVHAAAQAARQANPGTGLMLDAEYYPSLSGYIDGMYRAVPGLNADFGAVAVQPYSFTHSPGDRRDRWGVRRLEDVHRRFVAHGAGAKPMWITEIGWSTCPGSPGWCVSEARQARYVTQLFGLVRGRWRGYVRGVFLYHLRDFRPGAPADKEQWFGLERLDGAVKPAFRVLQRIGG